MIRPVLPFSTTVRLDSSDLDATSLQLPVVGGPAAFTQAASSR